VNRRIRAPEVRLIDEDGGQLGIVNLAAALTLAEEKGLDLVEVAPTAAPPVCRVMDYGKFVYEQRKRQREGRKAQPASVVKEIKISAKIETHDINFKIAHITKFLAQKHRVKVTVVFRGREVSHSELGRKVLNQVAAVLEPVALVESEPRLEGKMMWMLLAPAKKTGGAKPRTA
jgi:translation initiation factor IF-3